MTQISHDAGQQREPARTVLARQTVAAGHRRLLREEIGETKESKAELSVAAVEVLDARALGVHAVQERGHPGSPRPRRASRAETIKVIAQPRHLGSFPAVLTTPRRVSDSNGRGARGNEPCHPGLGGRWPGDPLRLKLALYAMAITSLIFLSISPCV